MGLVFLRHAYSRFLGVRDEIEASLPPKANRLETFARSLARARTGVVERSHSYTNRFRRLLIRWEKNPDNYQAFLHVAFAVITWKAAGFLGLALRPKACNLTRLKCH